MHVYTTISESAVTAKWRCITLLRSIITGFMRKNIQYQNFRMKIQMLQKSVNLLIVTYVKRLLTICI
ncbi:hypothetical protein HID58_030798 [Brassica napus]|uniref:Uncharacterized protein n=1 Tax=Brassica napus TaxID=3708 RepID=A0ABQ8CGZ8_BRANA|nr:hypothetical protein HID58_030798 [Brassica napus]